MLDRAIYGMVIYAAVVTVLFTAWCWNNWHRPTCPNCYYPLDRCECDKGDYGHDPNVARTFRVVEGGRK